MIKLFYDKQLRIEAEKFQLFPLLEVLEMANSPLKSIYQIVDNMEDCDFGIIPMNVQFLYLQKKKREVEDFIEKCQFHGKKVLVFSGGDFGLTIKSPQVITVRLGGFHSRLDNNTHIMPPFIKDPYLILGKKFHSLEKPLKPSLGFVGHANGSILKFCKEYILHVKGAFNKLVKKDVTDKQFFYPSSLRRYVYLKNLLKSPEIVCNFIFRKQYRAGVKTASEKEKTTHEFYKNINENLYTFCSRGTGNFSVRFYETLAMGRIPVVIDTDCRLPFYKTINWDSCCIRISEGEINKMEEKIIAFHTHNPPEKILSIQQQNRMIWEKYLTKDVYFKELALKLENIKNTV
ncbi:glycosyltransferase family 47 protein [Aureisphaera sp. CAU 1614]|uniref:Glycosyltransferase family 47 protein n=1 Tax=Halomarinibacterium sedimenti TaxID=2857106 RepID=A0A9X1FNE2_9FLAO|nr:exostosin family protein [Halomarinibacterium sedimenti]MBW2937704.1 glycosyltransferase family 47 protein [Halomarinibacterium sedimenti]